jgi:hypothetical protein
VKVDPGLCSTCVFARVVESAKGSQFWLCRRAETDERFRRYPALPVVLCAGYEAMPEGRPRSAPPLPKK